MNERDLRDAELQVREAHQRISPHIRTTPLQLCPTLSARGQAHVYLKLENEQITGSFKARGAFNKIKKLTQENPDVVNRGVLAASTGNHGMACALAMKTLGVKGSIFVPEGTQPAKLTLLKQLGVPVEKYGLDCVEGENHARKTAKENGMEFISPYNDIDVIAGQGTIGLEVVRELGSVDAVFVAVGGGGLIGGIAAYLKTVNPAVKVVGCCPMRSKVLYESVRAGQIVYEESGETLSDGTAGGVEENAITLDFCTKYVDDWVMVTETEIEEAIYLVMEQHHKIIEGAAGVSVAAYMKQAPSGQYKDQNVVIVICGGNISMDNLKMIINKNCTTKNV